MATTTRLHIIQTLISAKKPLMLSHIAQRMHASIQIVDYNARKMVCDGILLKNQDNEYFPQPYFLDGFLDSLFVVFYPYIEIMQEKSDQSQAQNGSAIFENFRIILQLFEAKIGELASRTVWTSRKIAPGIFYLPPQGVEFI